MQSLSCGLTKPILVRDLDLDLARTTPSPGVGWSMVQLKVLCVGVWSYWQALSHPFHILRGSIGRTGQVVFFYIDYICAFMRLARLPTTNIKNNGS